MSDGAEPANQDMGALVSRTRKRAKAYVLRPFKRRGYFLTAEEIRERNPTIFDKIASGKYTEEAVEKMKLKRRDDFVALRREMLARTRDPAERAGVMAKFFTSRKPPRRSRVNLPHEAWAPGAGTGAGVGAIGGGVSGAGVPSGQSQFARLVSVDDAPVGSLPDPRDVALGRNHRRTNEGGDKGVLEDVGGEPRSRPSSSGIGARALSASSIHRALGSSLYDDASLYDDSSLYDDDDECYRDEWTSSHGGWYASAVRGVDDFVASPTKYFESDDERMTDDVGEPVPATLRKRMVEQDGVAVEYPRPAGLRRWDGYVAEEDGKIARVLEEERKRRAEHNREMRRIYKRRYGRWGRKPTQREAPEWTRNPTMDAPWRRPNNREGTKCTTREAVEGLAHELRSGTYGWWGAMELRRGAIVREENAVGAAEKTWGETSGAQAWKESKPPAGGLSTAVATGHAGGISASRGTGPGCDVSDGPVTNETTSAALREDRAENGRWRAIRAEHREAQARARAERERIKAERAASRNSKRKAGV